MLTQRWGGINMKLYIRLIIGVLVVAGISVGWYFFTHQNYQPKTETTSTKQRNIVVITNKSEYQNQFSSENLSAAQTLLYKQVKLDTLETKPTYQATVRSGSFAMISDSEQQVMVDIPELKYSYVLNFSNADGSSNQVINIMCPKPAQLIYREFICHEP